MIEGRNDLGGDYGRRNGENGMNTRLRLIAKLMAGEVDMIVDALFCMQLNSLN
jgi:hypothetical protein